MARRPTTRELADRLHSFAIHLLRAVRAGDDVLGMSSPRLSALSVLVFGGATTVGELARAEGVRAPTMTRMVQALERDGYVQTGARAGQDGRFKTIAVTARGRAILERARERRLAAIEAMLSALPARDAAAVEKAVTALERSVAGLREPPRKNSERHVDSARRRSSSR